MTLNSHFSKPLCIYYRNRKLKLENNVIGGGYGGGGGLR